MDQGARGYCPLPTQALGLIYEHTGALDQPVRGSRVFRGPIMGGRGPHPRHAARVEAAKAAYQVLLARGVEAAELDRITANAEKKHSKYAEIA